MQTDHVKVRGIVINIILFRVELVFGVINIPKPLLVFLPLLCWSRSCCGPHTHECAIVASEVLTLVIVNFNVFSPLGPLTKLLLLPFLPSCFTLSAEFSCPLPCLLIIHRVTGEHKQGILSLYVFRHISFQSSSSCIKRRIKGSQGCCSHFHTQNGPSQ